MASRHIITPLPTDADWTDKFWYPLPNPTLGNNILSPHSDCLFVMGVFAATPEVHQTSPLGHIVDEASPWLFPYTLGNRVPSPTCGNVAPFLSLCLARNLHPWKLLRLSPASDRLCWSGFRVTSPRTGLPFDTIPLLIVRGSDGASPDGAGVTSGRRR